jgi:O-antigen chain-terminating methyltransferase
MAPTATHLAIDWLQFAKKFRGSEEYVRSTQEMYVGRFRSHTPVLDLACGRGEFLELAHSAGMNPIGVEANSELVALCRAKGLTVECADAFHYLESAEPASLGGILCSQMVEHLPPADVIRLVQLAHRALRPGGLLAIETPNPECLAIFATHFYLDPSHTKPIPPALMAFHFEEAGFGQVRIERLRPAVETMPSLAALPAEFREAFFGTLDYAAFGIKL